METKNIFEELKNTLLPQQKKGNFKALVQRNLERSSDANQLIREAIEDEDALTEWSNIEDVLMGVAMKIVNPISSICEAPSAIISDVIGGISLAVDELKEKKAQQQA